MDPQAPGTPVSIALCTYNGEKYLRDQVDSILNQTHRNLELVIVDDASRDGTLSIIKEYSSRDPRVRYTVNETNLGYNKNFEKALLLCKHDHIAISDQDDIWELNKIETMLRDWPPGSILIYSLSGSFQTGEFDARENGKLITKDGTIRYMHELIFSGHMHGHACMFKKELLSYCVPFPSTLFYDAWISFYAVGIAPIGCVPHTLTWHRVHQANSSRELTSITDRHEREQKLREQMIGFIDTFCSKGFGDQDDNRFLLEYSSLLKTMDGKKFHPGMFRFIMKNRYKVFHYKKKKPLLFFSHLKHALRMARRGLL